MEYPFWGNLIMTFDVQQSLAIQTMATDGKVLQYNPYYVDQQDEIIVRTDLAHEACHKLFLDSFRRGSRDHKLWNVATDYRINLTLKDSGLKLGYDYLLDERFRGWDAEKIYDFLKNNPDDPASQQAQAQGGCGCGGLKDHPSTKSGEPSNGEGEGQQPAGGDGDGDGDGEGQGGNMTDVDFGEAEVLMEIAAAANFAKSQGNMPGALAQHIKEILDPKISWEQVLQEFMEQCQTNDFSWQIRDRRMSETPAFVPALESEGVDTFVVAVDTSGSTRSFLGQFLAEVSAIGKLLKFNKLVVIFCDAKVQHVDEYGPEDLPIKPGKLYGGGGTDFRPVFHYVEEQMLMPKGMVFLTDTYGSFPDSPDYKVLWVVPAKEHGSVPFGEMLEYDD